MADVKHNTTFYQGFNTDAGNTIDSKDYPPVAFHGPQDNETSDVSFSIHPSTIGNNVSVLQLSSLEVDPGHQRLIEPTWNRLYFEKVPQINADANQLIFQTSDGTNHTISIPPTYNLLVSVDTTNPEQPVFETKTKHYMDVKTPYNYEVSLVGTSSVHPRVPIGSTNIESETKVRATLTMPAGTSGPFGYLWHEPAGTMKDFMDYLNRRIQQKLPHVSAVSTVGAIRFENTSTSYTGGGGDEKVYLVPTPLSKLLGFLDQKTVALPVSCSESPPWLSYGLLQPGNSPYTSLQWALTYSISHKIILPMSVIYTGMQFGDSGTHEVHVSGYYTIATLCDALSVQGKVVVEFSENDRKFRFTSGEPFSIEFNENNYPYSLQNLMGFGSVILRKQLQQFVSISPVYDVPISCSPSLIEYDENHQKLLTVRYMPHITNQMKVEETAGSGGLLLTLRSFTHPRGHGYAKGTLLRVTKTSSAQHHNLPIEDVIAYDAVTVRGLGTGLTVGDTVTVQPAVQSHLSLVMDRERHACIPPYLFGFQDKTVFTGGDAPYISSHKGFPYVLVELVSPSPQPTNLEHSGEIGSRSVIGKVQLGPHPATGISFQTVPVKFTNARCIAKLRLRLLNPDYSLFHLHNHSWSCTIKFN